MNADLPKLSELAERPSTRRKFLISSTVVARAARIGRLRR